MHGGPAHAIKLGLQFSPGLPVRISLVVLSLVAPTKNTNPTIAKPESARPGRIIQERLAEECCQLLVLPPGKLDVHDDQDRGHQKRRKGRPLDVEGEDDQDQPQVLGMAEVAVDPRRARGDR